MQFSSFMTSQSTRSPTKRAKFLQTRGVFGVAARELGGEDSSGAGRDPLRPAIQVEFNLVRR
jgi:hypothetical protein